MTRRGPQLHALDGRPGGSRLLLWTLALVALVLVSACSSPLDDDDQPEATATATASPTPTVTPTPSPSPTPTVTPTATPFVPPTVAVQEDDSVQSCLERNITPELLISLSRDETELTEDIFRTCLEQSIPSELIFLLDPIIEDASECALDVSKTLSHQQLITLAGPDGPEKDQIVEDVVTDILGCLGDKYGIDFT